MRELSNIIVLFIIFHSSHAAIYSSDLQQESPSNKPVTLKIGIKTSPPFIVENNGGYGGISVTFWNMVNEDLDFDYEFIHYDDVASLLSAVENNEVDLSINPITVSDRRMNTISFSQPYFITETAVARKKESKFLIFAKNVVSWQFFSALAALVSIIFIFGFLVWFFERKKNPEQFGGKYKGIAQGFWWSAVTMTTVGYGDKSPLTTGGRIVGFIWMFSAIVLISGLTASIASALTIQSIEDAIHSAQDLNKFKVITIKNSNSDQYLQVYNIQRRTTEDVDSGLQEILNGDAEVFVYDKPILLYAVNTGELDGEIVVLEKGLKTDYYSFSFPKNSPLVSQIDPPLIAKLRSMEWRQIVEKYK